MLKGQARHQKEQLLGESTTVPGRDGSQKLYISTAHDREPQASCMEQEIKSLGMLKEQEAWRCLECNTKITLFPSMEIPLWNFFPPIFFPFHVQMFTISAAQEAHPSVNTFTTPLKPHPIPPVGTRQTQPHSAFCPVLLYPAHKTPPSAKSPSDHGWGLESWL